MTETVYLGRASFRITHEMDTVPAEEAPADSSTWFSRDSSVILQGGPDMIDRLAAPAEEPAWEQAKPARRWFKRPWLMVAVPAAAFSLGILVAPLTGSGMRSKSSNAAPVARTPVPPALPPSTIAAIVEKPAESPVANTPAPVVEAVPAVPVVAPAPAAVVAPTTSVAVATKTAAPEPRRMAVPPAAMRQGRLAKRHDARSVKSDRPAAVAAADDDVAMEAPRPAVKKATAAEWVDPWAN